MSQSLVAPTPPAAIAQGRWSPWWLLLAGPFAGAVLGAVARGWMRLITDDPEFSWSGTLVIVIAFTLTGFGHSVAWAVRSAGWRRRGTVARVVGAVLTLPLFGGAGALMLPMVVGGSLTVWRRDWPRWVRWIVAALAAAPPVLVVAGTLHDQPTIRAASGLVLFLATYAVIIAGSRAVVAPVAGAPPMRRATRVVAVAGVVLLLLAIASFTVGIATADL